MPRRSRSRRRLPRTCRGVTLSGNAARSDGLSTPAVYAELDRLRAGVDIRPRRGAPQADPGVLQALRAGSAGALAEVARNDLQRAACSLAPDLVDVMGEGDAHGALTAFVSGSGPTVAFLADGAEAADALTRSLRGLGRETFVAHGPVPGARIVP